jgi:hypothetical protein
MADPQINAHFDHAAQSFTLSTQEFVLLREFTFPILVLLRPLQVPHFQRVACLKLRHLLQDPTQKNH